MILIIIAVYYLIGVLYLSKVLKNLNDDLDYYDIMSDFVDDICNRYDDPKDGELFRMITDVTMKLVKIGFVSGWPFVIFKKHCIIVWLKKFDLDHVKPAEEESE